MLAAELFPGELVGVEFLLPNVGPVLAKARVCYQERLRCGLQFLAIPAEQREMLGAWSLEEPKHAAKSVEIRSYQVIYEITDDIKARIFGLNAAGSFALISSVNGRFGTCGIIRLSGVAA